MRPARRRLLFWLSLLVPLGALALWLARPQPVPVEVVRVDRGPIVAWAEGEGRTRVRDRREVRAPVSGTLGRIVLDPGDPVRAGSTVLARIRPPWSAPLDPRTRAVLEGEAAAAAAALEEARARVAAARAALDLAEREHARILRLVERRIAPRSDLERAAAELARARADLAAAEALVREREALLARARAALRGPAPPDAADPACGCVEIRAPVDGVVLAVIRREAGPVSAGEPLLLVGDPRDVELVLEIASEEAVGVRPGARAEVSGWGGPAFAARVRRVEPFARTVVNALGIEEQRTRVVLDPVDPPEGLAGEGYRVRIAVERARIDDALRVPDGALVRTPAGWAVFVVGGGRARRRPVEVLLRGRGLVAVAGDLVAGERVVLWPGDLADGAAVEAREVRLDTEGAGG